jgi:hypothetical protein
MKKHWCCLHRELTRCSISINLVNSVWRGVHGQIWWWHILCTQSQVVACVVTRGGCNQCTLEIKLNTLCMLYQDKTNHSWVHRYGPRAVGSPFVEKTRKCYLKLSVFADTYKCYPEPLIFFWTVLLSNNFFTGSTYFQLHYWYFLGSVYFQVCFHFCCTMRLCYNHIYYYSSRQFWSLHHFFRVHPISNSSRPPPLVKFENLIRWNFKRT